MFCISNLAAFASSVLLIDTVVSGRDVIVGVISTPLQFFSAVLCGIVLGLILTFLPKKLKAEKVSHAQVFVSLPMAVQVFRCSMKSCSSR